MKSISTNRGMMERKVSKKLVRLVRHELSHSQREDGAIAFKHVWPRFTSDMKVKIPPYVVLWPTRIWLFYLSIGVKKKRLQYCVNPDHPEHIQYIRALKRHLEARIDMTIRNMCSKPNP